MASPTSFTAYVRPYLPGCIDAVMEPAILRAVRRFAKDTLCWTDEVTEIAFADGTEEYSVSPPADSRIVAGVRVWAGDDEDTANFIEWAFDRDNRVLTISSGVEDGATVHFLVALEPTNTAVSVPDIFLNEYLEGVKSAVVAELAAVPGNPWTNFELGQYHDTLYQRIVNRTKVAGNKGHTTKSLRVKPRLFA